MVKGSVTASARGFHPGIPILGGSGQLSGDPVGALFWRNVDAYSLTRFRCVSWKTARELVGGALIELSDGVMTFEFEDPEGMWARWLEHHYPGERV